ncbi:rab-GTPase-TBC domain-containing protein [Geranomyces variabilis]|nr:rab-GTPase-TBC domain-containing protein [Geranomyces variabilis]
MNLMRKNTETGGTLARKNVASKAELMAEKSKNEEAAMMADIAKLNTMSIRFTKFKTLLDMPVIDLVAKTKLVRHSRRDPLDSVEAAHGKPQDAKALLTFAAAEHAPAQGHGRHISHFQGYLPSSADRRDATLQRKRKEYEEYVAQSFGRGKATLDQALYHQIHIDVNRTHANIPLYQTPRIQEALERVLYCWAIRHPASGYVQGINDLVTPFFHVFLQSQTKGDVERADLSLVSPETLMEVEADSFWCLTKLLDGIQDNYTHLQPGITRQISRLKELINRIDARLYTHLQSQGVEFIQFAFRWMNCLLMRELSLRNTIRMWDSYQAEGTDGFSDFHLYVCAAFLVKWTEQLKKLEFQDMMMFLQSLPTQNWDDKDIELLLSEAYMWKSLFHNSPNHLSTQS